MIRPVDNQFSNRTVKKIKAIQSRLDYFPFTLENLWYASKELKLSLESGLILASLRLIMSITEAFFRDLLLYILLANRTLFKKYEESELTYNDPDIDCLEIFLEDSKKPSWTFNNIIKELERFRIITQRDAQKLLSIYKQVRIPIDHGLLRRFIRGRESKSITDEHENILIYLSCKRFGRKHAIEEKIENEGIRTIENLVSIINKYSLKIKLNNRQKHIKKI